MANITLDVMVNIAVFINVDLLDEIFIIRILGFVVKQLMSTPNIVGCVQEDTNCKYTY